MRLGQTSIVFYASNLLASLLSFAATIYFTQLLGPEVFGTYSLVVVLVAWLQFGGDLGLTSAIKKRLSESGSGPQYLVAGAVSVGSFFVATALLVVVFAPYVNEYVGAEAVWFVVGLLFAKIFIGFVRTALEGQHQVHVSGVLEPLQRFGQSVVQIGLLTLGLGLAGMLAGAIAGIVFAAVVGLTRLRIDFVRPAREHFESLFSFAQFSWVDSLRGKSFTWMDIFVLGFFVPQALVGFYNAAWNVASFLAFGNAISSSFFPEISEVSSEGDLGRVGSLVSDTLAFNGLFLIPGFVGALLLGDRILLFYGPTFPRGYPALVVLVGSLLVYGYFKQLLNTLLATDHPELAFRSNAVFVGGNVALNVVLVWQFGWLGAAVGSLLASTLALLVSYRYLTTVVTFSTPYRELGTQVAAAAAMGGALWAVLPFVESTTFPVPTYVVTVVLVGVGAAVYFLALVSLSPRFRSVVRDNVAPLQ
jgi:O-antigen/teichoic acid export membrane protein